MGILSHAEITSFADACLGIAAQAAAPDGFVSIRSLLRRFNAEIQFRPLLVEAMLCEVTDSESGARWKLLIDSDRYHVEPASLERETAELALPQRLRNTVSHELTHSLAFRHEEFGVQLAAGKRGGKIKAEEEVAEIEEHTETLSPLLLVPDTAVDRSFPASLPNLTIAHLQAARQIFGVSRFVLINRLNLLRTYGNTRLAERDCMQNVAVGVGRWSKDGTPLLLSAPLYERFEGNHCPEFLHKLRRHRSMPLYDLGIRVAVEGGLASAVAMDVPAGTSKIPNGGRLRVEVSIEPVVKKSTGSFFFLVRATK